MFAFKLNKLLLIKKFAVINVFLIHLKNILRKCTSKLKKEIEIIHVIFLNFIF